MEGANMKIQRGKRASAEYLIQWMILEPKVFKPKQIFAIGLITQAKCANNVEIKWNKIKLLHKILVC